MESNSETNSNFNSGFDSGEGIKTVPMGFSIRTDIAKAFKLRAKKENLNMSHKIAELMQSWLYPNQAQEKTEKPKNNLRKYTKIDDAIERMKGFGNKADERIKTLQEMKKNAENIDEEELDLYISDMFNKFEKQLATDKLNKEMRFWLPQLRETYSLYSKTFYQFKTWAGKQNIGEAQIHMFEIDKDALQKVINALSGALEGKNGLADNWRDIAQFTLNNCKSEIRGMKEVAGIKEEEDKKKKEEEAENSEQY